MLQQSVKLRAFCQSDRSHCSIQESIWKLSFASLWTPIPCVCLLHWIMFRNDVQQLVQSAGAWISFLTVLCIFFLHVLMQKATFGQWYILKIRHVVTFMLTEKNGHIAHKGPCRVRWKGWGWRTFTQEADIDTLCCFVFTLCTQLVFVLNQSKCWRLGFKKWVHLKTHFTRKYTHVPFSRTEI